MAWYRCYIHSVGGGVYCEGPLEFKNKFGAEKYAYDMAIDDYESFEGYHGIPDIGVFLIAGKIMALRNILFMMTLGSVIKRNEKIGLITG